MLKVGDHILDYPHDHESLSHSQYKYDNTN